MRCFTILLALLWAAAAVAVPPPPRLAAAAWFLQDASTGYVIASRNPDQRLPPASLTKLMTSYILARELAAGRLRDSDTTVVSERAWAQNPLFAGSSLMWIEVGKRVSMADLHRGVVVSSGNDASLAIAEHIAGTEEVFTEIMNGAAAALGMENTRYANSHGLDANEHYTSARDLAILSAAFIRRYPEAYALYAERDFTYNNIKQYNRNPLIPEDPSVDGIKTGYTETAGYCLVSSAKRRGMRLIAVVMGADSEQARKRESRKLLDYGFRNYETIALYEPGDRLRDARVWQGTAQRLRLGVAREARITLARGERERLQAVLEVDKTIRAPVEEGAPLGRLLVSLDGEALLDEPLVSLDAVPAAGFIARMRDNIVLLFAYFFGDD